MDQFNKSTSEIERAEHISPEKTGDNIEAKRVANYVWNAAEETWVRQSAIVDTQAVNIDEVGGSSFSLGQTTAASSLPVTIASDQIVDVNLATALSGEDETNDALRIEGFRTEMAGFSAGLLNADLVPSTNVSNYASFSLQITGTFSGTLTIQGSNDDSDFRSMPAKFSNSTANAYTTTFAGQGIIEGPIFYKYLRVRMTAYTSGTATGVLMLSTIPHSPTSVGIDTELPGAGAAADGAGNPTAPFVNAARSNFNGTTWDRNRNNVEGTVLTSQARTTTTNSTDQTNYNARGVLLLLNVSSEATGETLSLKIQAKDPVSANYTDYVDLGVIYDAATDAPGTKLTAIYPGLVSSELAAGAKGKAAPMPRVWRAVVTHSASSSWTYSLGYEAVL